MKKRLSIAIAFVLSVVIHFGSYISLYFAPPARVAAHQSLEVTLVEAKPKVTDAATRPPLAALKQIVEQNKTVNDDVPDHAKYLSQFNQKVKKETRAALTGKYQNSGGQGQASNHAPATPESAKSEKMAHKKTESKDLPTVGVTQNFSETAPSARERLTPSYDWTKAVRERDTKEDLAAQVGGDGQAASQTNDYLPEQERGIQTMLNTREFIYYSYYNRIKHQLNQFWEPKIKEKVTDLFRHGRRVASNQDHITKLLIILNAQGSLVGVKVLGPSGEMALDEAAVEAFQAAAPFPNPPKGIVESDGTVKIRWDFILEV